MTKDEKILEILSSKPTQKIGLDDFYGKQTVINMLKEAINYIHCCTELKADKQKLAFMDWIEVATLYDENGFYIYRKELWNIDALEKIHYAEYLSL